MSFKSVAALFLTGIILVNCSPEPPTKEECVAGLRNFMKLKLKKEGLPEEEIEGILESVPATMAEVCVKNRTAAEVQCEIQAKSLAELKACRQ